ncbi:MAG TPA: 3-deoxy-D-manno-octulosonic acid transferase [Beijerinckiaceae bacterium]|nr:3-deoxy-D-manno-octulosonic acid transferase [Beijerinckiaceae bacterium]
MSGALPAPLWLYRAGTALLEPAAVALLLWRTRRGKEDPQRRRERRGIATAPRPEGPLVWLHGASIGETLSLLPLGERLTRRGLNLLLTSGTRTSAELLSRRLPPGAVHQFLPVDVPRWVRRFLDHWRPDLVLFAESEIWPNVLTELDRRGVPIVLVNARLSERSARRWQKVPEAATALLSRFALCLAQSQADAERLSRLGAPVAVAGNLKFDVSPPPADPRVLGQLSGLVAGRPVWVAASTHPGEEEAVLAAHAAFAERPDLLTIIVPRHPVRGAQVASLAAAAGLAYARRSEGGRPDRDVQVYIADTVGELGLFYRLTPLAFMGGSLVPHGGQNPIEPAKLGAAILHGPHVHNFADVYAAIDRAGGALPVPDADALARSLADLLPDPGLTRDMARAAGDAVEALGGALDRTLRAIEPYLPSPDLRRAAP